MKNYLSILLAVLLLAGVSCQQKQEQSHESYQEEVKQKIADVTRLNVEVWENKDLDSVMTFLDEGYINMFNNTVYVNREQCRDFFKGVFDTYSIEDVEYKTIEIIVDQNYAIQTQLFKQKWITKDKKDTTYFDVRLMRVFKKQVDGGWKLFREFGQQ